MSSGGGGSIGSIGGISSGIGINGSIGGSNGGIGGSVVNDHYKKKLGLAPLRTRTFLNDLLCQTRMSKHPQMSEDDLKFPEDSLAASKLLQELWREHHPMLPDYGPAVLEVQNTLDALARADMAA
jgi:hypothetical protein